MRLTFRIGVALLVVASMGVVVGSSGFSSTEADRSVSVKVVDDGSAYVGLDGVVVDDDEELVVYKQGNNNESGENANDFNATYDGAAEVNNRFTEEVTVSVTVDEDESAPDTELTHANSSMDDVEVGIGENAIFNATVRCIKGSGNEYPSGTVTVAFHVEGESVSATVERETTVTCENNGNSNA